ncbi:MAG: hypothetical protein MI724_15990 [Spirochaetales bacterium]|nr:hypothetical protein [Spirochaetales bacterium]
MMRELLVSVMIAASLLVPAVGDAQEIVVTAETTFQWQSGTLEMDLSAVVEDRGINAPAGLHRAQQIIEREFAAQLFSGLLPLRLDSVRLVEDAVRDDPALAAQISELARRAERGLPRPEPDLRGISRTYRVPVFPDLTQLFVGHSIPFRMERVIEWIPTRDFSGIVIYAAQPLPLHGTDEEVLLAPALLPEIYDTNLRPILEQDMLDPDAIGRWGVVAYTEAADEDPWRARIGASPLRIMARQAFGILPTDIIIGEEDANRLLASAHNRELLRQGRILVILAPDRTTVSD